METDELIDLLAQDATPIRPLAAPWLRTITWLAASVMYVLLLTIFLSPRVSRVTSIHAPRFWLEQVAALTTAIAAAAAALESVIPGRSRRAWLLPVAPLGLWIGISAWACTRDWMVNGSESLIVHSDWTCLIAMVLGAALPATVIAFMLRGGAPLAPRATAALAALAVAGLGSVTACIARPFPHATTATVLAWHFGTLLIFVSAGACVGGHLLGWRLTPSVASVIGRSSARA